ncbi:alpha-glucosidase family protein [Gilvimarinus sp. SDUM040013]|uniref:Alpha-glucosidase family protein n=1 Tax=Gilvimarinus gilvus TaxID=3058038 RepID=A0ABU4S1R0_9GAMM|nr:alpha-glucosidase family protein [Gilvimarinus sp. SDUM040013]MDO3384448.1 alpha-glucosidase family protein [Gilvimarinus sp. SDUM040013]MDX6851083.1 alpha-glucosidase family protein [Gilvimarinus sp. SDUM040013]
MQQQPWWRGAIIYQVYPRSLMDSNGDGVGDIPGIISKLDYIASLGVDAIWVSPFFRSPMKDFGYDISDYRDVDPLFGTLDDIDELIQQSHQRGLKVMIDQVLSHTSDQHDWFQESRASRDNAKADWYVWADPSEDGTPPNNWLAIFGGSAWEWEPRRGQYYLHNFLKSQPDLNYHNPDVQAQMLEEVEFWLKRGVDGFRLDAINFCFHDKSLRSNPPKPAAERKGRGFSEDNPYAFQRHLHDNTQPENIAFLQKLRSLFDRYQQIVSLGEISSENSLQTMADYSRGNDKLHMTYSFELLTEEFSPRYIRETIATLEESLGEGWPCWAIGNHDVARVLSRWGGDHASDDLAKMLNAMLLSLRGSVCSYQGEELGLNEVELTLEQLQDPYGIAFWPMFKGRDGCRTPMPWNDQQHGGFSSVKPWLPVATEHCKRSVASQSADQTSVLNGYRNFTAWRKAQSALRYGDIEFIELHDDVLSFYRLCEEQTLLCCFNFSPNSVELAMPQGQWQVLSGHGFTANAVARSLTLPPFGVSFFQK